MNPSEMAHETFDRIVRLQDERDALSDHLARLLDELAALKKEVAELKRGEFICIRCGLRKDGEATEGMDF